MTAVCPPNFSTPEIRGAERVLSGDVCLNSHGTKVVLP